MDRQSSGSGSGGVNVGDGRMIAFGDYSEPVDYVLARERVVRSWGERERVERLRREVRWDGGEGIEGREGREVGLGIGIEGGFVER